MILDFIIVMVVSPVHKMTSDFKIMYDHERGNIVTGLFLSNKNTMGPAVDLLALVLRETSRDRE